MESEDYNGLNILMSDHGGHRRVRRVIISEKESKEKEKKPEKSQQEKPKQEDTEMTDSEKEKEKVKKSTILKKSEPPLQKKSFEIIMKHLLKTNKNENEKKDRKKLNKNSMLFNKEWSEASRIMGDKWSKKEGNIKQEELMKINEQRIQEINQNYPIINCHRIFDVYQI